jgi:hypothetical protein
MACNNNKSEKKTESDTTMIKPDTVQANSDELKINIDAEADEPDSTAATKDAQGFKYKVNSFTLSGDQQRYLFDNKKVKQIKFKFSKIKTEENGTVIYGLKAYGVYGDGLDLRKTDAISLTATTDEFTFTDKTHRNQRLTRGDFRIFYDLPASTDPIPSATFVNLLFTPTIIAGSENHVRFRVTRAPTAITTKFKMNVTGDIITNPSPPADPCLNLCDEGSQIMKIKD